jgi:hypothetical protein
VRWAFYPDARRLGRQAALLLLSACTHALLAVLIVLFDLNTNIQVEISWSNEPLSGIGTQTVLVASPPDTHVAELAQDEPPIVEPPKEDIPRWPKRKIKPVPTEKPTPPDKPAAPDKPKTVKTARHVQIQDTTPILIVTKVDQASEPLPPPQEPVIAEDSTEIEAEDSIPEDSIPEDTASPAAEKLSAVMLAASRLGQSSDEPQPGHVGEALPGLAEYGPGNARLIVVIRNDRVRGSIYEEHTRKLLMAFPDYQIALSKSGIDPIESLDAFVIATANPALYTETFLAVRHQLEDRVLKLALKHSFLSTLEWSEYQGRPIARPTPPDDPVQAARGIYARSVLFAEPGLTLFLPNTLLPAVFEAAPVDDENDGHDVGQAPRTLLDTLTAFENIDGAEETAPAVFIMLKGITSMRFGNLPELPTPIALTASLTPAENPRIVLRLEYPDETGAIGFIDAWPEFIRAAGRMGIPGLGGLLGAITWNRDGAQVFGDGELNGLFVGLILSFATSSIPQVSG